MKWCVDGPSGTIPESTGAQMKLNNGVSVVALLVLGLLWLAMPTGGYASDDLAAIRKAADMGDAKSQFELGKLYKSGQGVRQDDNEAARWYRKAAAQGLASAKEALEALDRQKAGKNAAACADKAHTCLVDCDKTRPKDSECKSQCYQAKFSCEGR
ncbi:MAG: sel1 repeat family protein [Magnetococcales bacterium]|nr:sel1 repeat family protein [Magnetococcales bacterium]